MARAGARTLIVFAAFALAGTLGACSEGEPSPESPPSLAAQPTAAPPTVGLERTLGDDPTQSRNTAIVRASSRVAPSVVTVNVLRAQRAPRSAFERFFPPAMRRTAGFGSGFIVEADGIVLTNEHVIRGAQRVMVTLADGRDFEAELVGFDEVTDVAVLRIQERGLPVAPLDRSGELIIGEWVVAIGNPFGTAVSNTEPTVTVGVVSAVGRHIVPNSEEASFYLGMIQTDAAINPGNSGGPLVNALGQVIGINSSIFSRSGGSEGLGFAIPIARALRVADDLLRLGDVQRAWLGFDVEPAQADEWGRTSGVQVSTVAPGSPADRAGIQPGVRLLAANGQRLTTPLDFLAVLLDLRAGDAIDLEIEGSRRSLSLSASSLPTVRAERVTALRDLDVITVTPEVQAEQGLRLEYGALIVSITPALEQRLGFRVGDVIVRINNRMISTAEELASFFDDPPLRGLIRIFFERNGDFMPRSFVLGG